MTAPEESVVLQDGASHWIPDPAAAPPLREATIADLLDEAVARGPSREALVYSAYDAPELTLRLTYAELRERAIEIAAALIGSDLGPGDKALVWATNLPQHSLLQLACAYAGVVLVPVNPLYRRDELAFVLERARPSAVFLLPEDRGVSLWDVLDAACGDASSVRRRVALGDAPDGRGVAWDDWLADAGRDVGRETVLERRAHVVPADLAQIQFTSGTTGNPKGVELTHWILANQGIQIAHRAGLEPADRYVNPMPQFHCGGCVVGALGILAAGATQLPIVSFDARLIDDTIDAERATVVAGVPTMLLAMEEERRRGGQRLDTLRTVISGGSPVPPALGREWQQRLGVAFAITYGQTEFGPVATFSSPRDSAEDQIGTVGRPLGHVELDIVVPGTEQRVPVGTEGELRYRGFTMRGYHRDPEATAEAVSPDGWLRSGDLGSIDAGGYVRITGRAKEMIIRGGENIAPAAVEHAVRTLDGVADVSVVGVPDERFGEELCAWVRLEAGASLTIGELRDALAERVARFKIPRYLVVVDALPLTPSGKVQRFRLQERFASALADGSAQDSRAAPSSR